MCDIHNSDFFPCNSDIVRIARCTKSSDFLILFKLCFSQFWESQKLRDPSLSISCSCDLYIRIAWGKKSELRRFWLISSSFKSHFCLFQRPLSSRVKFHRPRSQEPLHLADLCYRIPILVRFRDLKCSLPLAVTKHINNFWVNSVFSCTGILSYFASITSSFDSGKKTSMC